MKKLFLSVLFVLTSAFAAFGQGTYVNYQAPAGPAAWAQNSLGAVYRVCTYSTSPAGPCSPTSSIFSDRALSASISQTSGVKIPQSGQITFFVAPGTYTVQYQLPSAAGSQYINDVVTAGADSTALGATSLAIQDPTDTTKQIKFSASGNTTGITETIASAANVAATVTLPNATSVLEGSLGNYQGTTSVGITDTNFHALIAAASDVKIPANTLNAAGKKIRVHGSGIYTNAAASLLNARVDLCTVSGCATGTDFAAAGCAVVTTNQANNLTNGQFSIDCNFTTTSTLGASGTAMAKALVCANLGSAVTAVQSCFQDQATAVSAAFDETVDEFVNISFKFSTSNAGNSAILHEMSVELVK